MTGLPLWGRVLIWIGVALAAALTVRFVVSSYEDWRDEIATSNYTAGDRAGAARVKVQWDEDRAKAQAATIEAQRVAALETQRRLERQQENQRAQDALLAAARRDAQRARDAADGLQLRAATYLDAAGCGADLSAGAAVECIRKAVAAISDALGSCGRIAVQAAADADDSRARGLKCEADYDSLTLKLSP